MLHSYLPLLVMLLAVGGLGLLCLRRSVPVAPGQESEGQPRSRELPFRVALLLVSAILVVFLVPWTLTLRTLPRKLAPLSLLEVLVFSAILGVGLLHVWRRAGREEMK